MLGMEQPNVGLFSPVSAGDDGGAGRAGGAGGAGGVFRRYI